MEDREELLRSILSKIDRMQYELESLRGHLDRLQMADTPIHASHDDWYVRVPKNTLDCSQTMWWSTRNKNEDYGNLDGLKLCEGDE